MPTESLTPQADMHLRIMIEELLRRGASESEIHAAVAKAHQTSAPTAVNRALRAARHALAN